MTAAALTSTATAARTVTTVRADALGDLLGLLPADGALSCWGDDALGQATPPSGTRFIAVGVGESHTCALAVDRTLRCWGDNAAGQAEALAGTFDQLSVGRQHACAREHRRPPVARG